MNKLSLRAIVAIGTVVLLINSGYIAAFASPTIFYMGNVLARMPAREAGFCRSVWQAATA